MTDILSADPSVLWSEVGAISQSLATIFAVWALIYSMTTFRKSMAASHYGELDNMYFQLLQLTLDKPYLANPPACTEAQKPEYDVYAFMVWNFLETILDRCQGHQDLMDTWSPIIETEGRLHRAWFEDPANRDKFKDSFHRYIRENVLLPARV